jgi:hypothetical protein
MTGSGRGQLAVPLSSLRETRTWQRWCPRASRGSWTPGFKVDGSRISSAPALPQPYLQQKPHWSLLMSCLPPCASSPPVLSSLHPQLCTWGHAAAVLVLLNYTPTLKACRVPAPTNGWEVRGGGREKLLILGQTSGSLRSSHTKHEIMWTFPGGK